MVESGNISDYSNEKTEIMGLTGILENSIGVISVGNRVSEPYHLEKGTILHDRYEVESVIGYGGFGSIYLCHDRELDNDVAVKEYYPTIFLNRAKGEKKVTVYDSKRFEEYEKGKREFLEEAQVLAKFNYHPNIVHVFDFFEENETAYFVMEYLEGCNLSYFLRKKREKGEELSVRDSVFIVSEILNGLSELHKSNILHRDIKPGNIFICKTGAIKIIDLGAARFSDFEIEKTRTVIITPGYAPYEQYEVKSKQGPYTDIYAVGAVLYEMLTGVKPDESINRKIEDTLVPPAKLNANVSRSLSDAVMRAMAIQPEIRYKSAEQFAEALSEKKHNRDANSEIRRKKLIKLIGICGIVILVVALFGIGINEYKQMKREAVLTETSLSLWISCKSGEELTTREMFMDASQEFLENNPSVTLDIMVVSEEEYEDKVCKALSDNSKVDVFVSDNAETLSAYVLPMDNFYKKRYFKANDYYLSYVTDVEEETTWVPLFMDIPVVYTNSLDGNDIMEEGFSLSDFIERKCHQYIGKVSDYSVIQKEMSGVYEVGFLQNYDEIVPDYYCKMSINKNISKEKQEASMRLIYYFLSDTSQDIFTIQNDNHFPVNKNIFDTFCEINDDFAEVNLLLEEK